MGFLLSLTIPWAECKKVRNTFCFVNLIIYSTSTYHCKVKLAQMEKLSKLIITLPFQVRSVEVSDLNVTFCIN